MHKIVKAEDVLKLNKNILSSTMNKIARLRFTCYMHVPGKILWYNIVLFMHLYNFLLSSALKKEQRRVVL